MKLIAEYIESGISFVAEAKNDGPKVYNIEGVFAQSEQKNRNGRFYPRKIRESAVGKYVDEYVSKKRAVGELNHPDGPSIDLGNVSHLITELRWEGNDVVGKARILDTPKGQIVRGLLDGGVQLGVSTRGMGSLEARGDAMYVRDDFILNTVDIVADPSAPSAFVNGIMEGVEWVWNNGVIQPQIIEKMETEIKNAPKKHLYETQVREFKNFLSLLKNSYKE